MSHVILKARRLQKFGVNIKDQDSFFEQKYEIFTWGSNDRGQLGKIRQEKIISYSEYENCKKIEDEEKMI